MDIMRIMMNTPVRSIRLDDDTWKKLDTIAREYSNQIIILDRTELIRLFIEYCCRDEKLLHKICKGDF